MGTDRERSGKHKLPSSERDEKVIALNEARTAEETANKAREELEGFNQRSEYNHRSPCLRSSSRGRATVVRGVQVVH
jgi:hypothetical protein